MNIVDGLDAIWTQILDILSLFVLPDWGALIALLPLFIFLGVVGPLVTALMLGTLVYQARKPRVKVAFEEEGPRRAEIGAGGEPIFPVGLPYCRRHKLIYPSGSVLCERGKEDLAVICPMCGVGRSASVDTCTNCGLILKVEPRAVALRTAAGPKPGGAAVA